MVDESKAGADPGFCGSRVWLSLHAGGTPKYDFTKKLRKFWSIKGLEVAPKSTNVCGSLNVRGRVSRWG